MIPRLKRALDGPAAGRVTTVVMLMTSIVVVVLGVRQENSLDCQARYNREAAAYDAAQAEADRLDGQALRDMVSALLEGDGPAFRARAEEYKRQVDASNAKRAQTPPPPPPRDLCD